MDAVGKMSAQSKKGSEEKNFLQSKDGRAGKVPVQPKDRRAGEVPVQSKDGRAGEVPVQSKDGRAGEVPVQPKDGRAEKASVQPGNDDEEKCIMQLKEGRTGNTPFSVYGDDKEISVEKRFEKPYLAAVSGVKNSGKTTFLEKLVPELTRRGYKVAVIKHDGHDFEGDMEGTDTYRMQKAGAYGTCIFSKHKWMLQKQEPDVDVERLAKFFPEADFILLEGMKDSAYPKFELVRKGNSTRSVCAPETMLALVTDAEELISEIKKVLIVGFEDIAACADLLEKASEGSLV